MLSSGNKKERTDEVMKRVYCLYRVSTKGQVDKDDIPMQKTSCRAFAERNGWNIVKEFQEKGVSGFKVSASDRDAIQDLKTAAEKKEFDVLLVFMFDRIGRIDDETPFVVEWFIKHGIEVWSVSEGEQRLDSHVDKLMNYIRFWQANGESQKTSTRVKTRLNQMTMEGQFTGGVAPFGYKLIKSGTFNKKGRELMEVIVDDTEAEIVRMIFDMTVKEGYGSYRMSAFLNEQGLRTHNGSKFQCNTINRILKNRMYCGYLIAGGVESPYMERLQIVDENVFEQAQYILGQRSQKNDEKQQIARTTKGSTLLSGNVYCAHCGNKMISTSYIDRYDRADGTQYKVRRQRYICTNKAMHRGACNGQSAYVAQRIDGAVIEILKSYLSMIKSTPKDVALERRYQSEISGLKKKQTRLLKETEKIRKQVVELSAEIGRSLIGESRFTPDMLSASIEATNALLHQKETELLEVQNALANQQTAMEKLDYYYAQFRTWAEEFESSSIEQKKMIVCQLIKEINISRGYEIDIVFDINYEQFISGTEKYRTLK